MADNNDKAALVQAASARALIRAMGMQAENAILLHRGGSPPYRLVDFEALVEDEGIGHSDVMEVLRG